VVSHPSSSTSEITPSLSSVPEVRFARVTLKKRTNPGGDSVSINDEPAIFMQPEKIVLLASTHESVACFHVKEELLPQFLRHLESRGIEVPEPPQKQGSPEIPYVKVNVKEGTPEQKLQEALEDFVKRDSAPMNY
jgi:hypothetical protein